MHPSTSLSGSDFPIQSGGARPSPETLRCTSTADFLAALPLLTGFTDQNSLFIVLFQGRLGGNVLRMELPETQSPHELHLLLNGVVTLLRESGAGAEGPAMVITTTQRFDESIGAPWGRLAHQLKRRMRREGWSLRELAVIAADGWCGLLGAGPGVPHPLREITESEFALSVRARGPQPRPLSSIGELPVPDPARTTAVAKHLHESPQRRARRGDAHPEGHSADWIRSTAELADTCFDWFRPIDNGPECSDYPPHPVRTSARRLAQLITAAQSSSPWLVLALTALTRAEFVVDVAHDSGIDRLTDIRIADNPAEARGTRRAWSIEHLLFSLAHEVPPQQKFRSIVSVLEDAIVHAPEEMRPSLLALLAWVWWMLGMQSVAARTITTSLELQSDHELTLMVQRLIANPPAAHLHRLRSEFDPAGAAA